MLIAGEKNSGRRTAVRDRGAQCRRLVSRGRLVPLAGITPIPFRSGPPRHECQGWAPVILERKEYSGEREQVRGSSTSLFHEFRHLCVPAAARDYSPSSSRQQEAASPKTRDRVLRTPPESSPNKGRWTVRSSSDNIRGEELVPQRSVRERPRRRGRGDRGLDAGCRRRPLKREKW